MYDRDEIIQGIRFKTTKLFSVITDMSLIVHVASLEELEQSGFPAAGVADDGIGFACVKTIGDIFEYRFLRSIGKAYIF